MGACGNQDKPGNMGGHVAEGQAQVGAANSKILQQMKILNDHRHPVAGEDRSHDLRIMRPTRCQLRYRRR